MSSAAERSALADKAQAELDVILSVALDTDLLLEASSAVLVDIQSAPVRRLDVYIRRLSQTDNPDLVMQSAAAGWVLMTEQLLKRAASVVADAKQQDLDAPLPE